MYIQENSEFEVRWDLEMKNYKLDAEEKKIEKEIEKYRPVDRKEYEQIVRAIAAYKKDAVLNLRINRGDLEAIKQKARKLGVKYQSLISEILHRLARS